MSSEALPRCETCVHNLHRTGDGRVPRPEPTDLCRNSLGVFHMTDCPITVGLACVYYDASPEPHPVTSDADLEAAREEMHPEFLGWRYRRRVRWLTKPKNLVPVGIVLETPPEPEEVVPETLAMRVQPPAPPPAVEGAAPADGPAAPAADGATPPPPPSAPERYPGQRRSEERMAKKRARLAALDAAAAAKAAQIAAASQAPPAEPAPGDDEDYDDEDDEFGGDLAEDEAPEDTGPKTVEQILAALPDAPLPERRERRPQGGGGPRGEPRGGPRGQGAGGGGGGGAAGGAGGPRRRRRRGRRGRGPGQGGGGPGQGGGQRPSGPPPAPRA